MLYVVAWPRLGEADDAALRRLRAQYHPEEAGLIGPHFTLVFGVPPDRQPGLQASLDGLTRRPFWFVLERIVRFDSYLFAEPAAGAAELTELHDAFEAAPSREPFQPHITVGRFARPAEAERVARIVERQHMPMHGRVEELALLRRDADGVTVLANRILPG